MDEPREPIHIYTGENNAYKLYTPNDVQKSEMIAKYGEKWDAGYRQEFVQWATAEDERLTVEKQNALNPGTLPSEKIMNPVEGVPMKGLDVKDMKLTPDEDRIHRENVARSERNKNGIGKIFVQKRDSEGTKVMYEKTHFDKWWDDIFHDTENDTGRVFGIYYNQHYEPHGNIWKGTLKGRNMSGWGADRTYSSNYANWKN